MTNLPPLSAEGETLLETIGEKKPTNHAIMLALRAVVFTYAPNASETVKYGGLHYTHGRPFCGIFSHSAHVTLEFSRGAEFHDGILLGNGTYRRHLRFTDPAAINVEQVGAYVAKACELA